MENNKEVEIIADHEEQHPVEAPPPQGGNPLQPPHSQWLPASGGMEGESEERPKTQEDYKSDPEKCCCGPGCFRRVLLEDYDECCCTKACVIICMCMAMVICCCRNGCSDSLYK